MIQSKHEMREWLQVEKKLYYDGGGMLSVWYTREGCAILIC